MTDTEELKNRLIELCSSEPFSIDEEKAFEVYELSRYLYQKTGNPSYLEVAQSTGYMTNYRYLLQEYLKAVESGREEYAYNVAKMYYEGKLGYTDYEKAYEYFSRAAETQKSGDGTFENSYKEVATNSKYYLAIMHRDGLSVDKDDKKYKDLLDELYNVFLEEEWYKDDRPEAYLEVADMLINEGRNEEGFRIVRKAADDQCRWIRYFNTNVKELAAVNEAMYRLVPFDVSEIGPRDITELVKRPRIILFRYHGQKHLISISRRNDENVIFYEGHYYKDAEKLITTALIGEDPFNEAMFETEDWEVYE